MGILKEQYEKIVAERTELIAKIEELEADEKVKKYLSLCGKKDRLTFQQKDLYKQMKKEEYSSCNHIWVETLHDYDCHEGRSYNYYGCIKCGLDQSVFQLTGQYYDLDMLTLEQRVMYDVMYGGTGCEGIDTKICCDLDLAKAIYSKIKEAHPNIDDETARKYFEIALYNIRENKVSDERKINRAKRLSLSPRFDKWTGCY